MQASKEIQFIFVAEGKRNIRLKKKELTRCLIAKVLCQLKAQGSLLFGSHMQNGPKQGKSNSLSVSTLSPLSSLVKLVSFISGRNS